MSAEALLGVVLHGDPQNSDIPLSSDIPVCTVWMFYKLSSGTQCLETPKNQTRIIPENERGIINWGQVWTAQKIEMHYADWSEGLVGNTHTSLKGLLIFCSEQGEGKNYLELQAM